MSHCPQVETDRDLLLDENFILPPGIESYSTDGDHLPLPPGRRRELDEHFYGELREPDTDLHQGYKRDPLSALPLQARMQAHIHKHRFAINQKVLLGFWYQQRLYQHKFLVTENDIM